MGPSGHIGYILHILDCLGQDMQVLYLGRAPRTKETLPDFLKWRRVTRPPLVFRGLTGSQRTPGFWGVTLSDLEKKAEAAPKDYYGEGSNGKVQASLEEENIDIRYSLSAPISFMGEMIFASHFCVGGNELVVMGEDAELLVEPLRAFWSADESKSFSSHMETVLMKGNEGFRLETEPFANLRKGDEDQMMLRLMENLPSSLDGWECQPRAMRRTSYDC